jgi:branched-chain amino acid transport system ATP-binding protein
MTAAAAETAPRPQILSVENVTLTFGGVTSLADVSLTQDTGEILAVIGPNGAGKTSMFNCLAGVYRPDSGRITFTADGRPPVSLLGRRPDQVTQLGIARTFQNIRLFNALTAFENVKIGIEARQKTGPVGAMARLPRTRREEREGDERAVQLLEFIGLRGRGDAIASSLAYGEQRRLEIARALGTQPRLLLLDEPAAGTTRKEKTELEALIRRIRDEMSVTVLLIEHDMRLVMALADRVVVLNFGKVIASGTPAKVQRHPDVVEAYLGTATEGAGDAP